MAKDKKEIVSDKRKTQDLQSFARLVMPFARQILGAKGLMEADLLTGWDEIVGAELAAYSLPRKIEFKRGEKNNGVLWIEVPAGAFALEVQLKESLILSKVNTYFGYAAVAKLKIIQNAAFDLQDEPAAGCERMQKTLVSQEEETYIKELSEGVENQTLQDMLIKLGRSVISNNKGENKKDEV